MIAAIVAAFTVIGQILGLGIRLFDLWREKDAEKAKQKKEAVNDAVHTLSETDIDNGTRAVRLSAALARTRRVR